MENIPLNQRLVVPARVNSLEPLNAWLDAFCRQENIAESVVFELQLVLEELLVNVTMHGGTTSDGDPEIIVNLERLDHETLVVTFSDNGEPFNPLTQETPEIGQSLENRAIGGLGIVLLKQMMSDISYRYERGMNTLVMHKPLPKQVASDR